MERVLQRHSTAPRRRPARNARLACSRRARRWRSVGAAKRLTAATLGGAGRPYEHSVFVQGAVWQINSFDQWGVELGKVLTTRIIPQLAAEEEPVLTHHSSTNRLIQRYRKLRGGAA